MMATRGSNASVGDSTFADLLPRLRSFLSTLTRRERFEASLDEEMRFHLAAHAEDLVRSGVPPARPRSAPGCSSAASRP